MANNVSRASGVGYEIEVEQKKLESIGELKVARYYIEGRINDIKEMSGLRKSSEIENYVTKRINENFNINDNAWLK